MSGTGTDARSGSAGGEFLTTRWSVVLSAGHAGSEAGRASLEVLCSSYWYPLYTYVRRRGHDADEARDLTQGFFTRLFEKQDIQDADPERGRFRAFLLTALKHYLANEWDREQAQKRGGGRVHVSIDMEGADERFGIRARREESPERSFERAWALALLERVLDALRKDYEARGKSETFAALKGFLTTEGTESQAAIAERLGTTEGAVKVAVHRLRGRYREAIRDEIASTLANPADIDAELATLFEALG